MPQSGFALLMGLLFAVMSGLAGPRALGQQTANEKGRDAMRRSDLRPWYDRQQDAVQRIDVNPPGDLGQNRASTWTATLPKANVPQLGWLVRVLYYLLIAAGIALVVFLIYLLIAA